MTPAADDAVATQLAAALERDGAGDRVGLALVGRLLARAGELTGSARARLVARAAALLESYRSRTPRAAPPPQSAARARGDAAWREALAARARARPPREVRTERTSSVLAEIRATAATARAADQVPDSAGPYNGAAVAARALDELASIAPGYLGEYVAWLEDLACLADLPARRAERRGAKRKA